MNFKVMVSAALVTGLMGVALAAPAPPKPAETKKPAPKITEKAYPKAGAPKSVSHVKAPAKPATPAKPAKDAAPHK